MLSDLLISLSHGWLQWIFLCLPGALFLWAFAEALLRSRWILSANIRYLILMLVLVKFILPSPFSIPLLESRPVIFENPLSSAITTATISESTSPQKSVKSPQDIPAQNNLIPDIANNSSPLFLSSAINETQQNNSIIVQYLAIGLFLLFSLVGFAFVLLGIWKSFFLISYMKNSNRDESLTALSKKIIPKLGIQPPRFGISNHVTVPQIAGCFSPYILLPLSILKRSTQEQELILAHELAHLRRRDHWLNTLQVLIGICCWWNPFVSRINYLIRREREYCCDALVMNLFPRQRIAYSRILLDCAEEQLGVYRASTALSFAGQKSALAQRIHYITSPKQRRPLLITGLITLIIFTGCLLVGIGWTNEEKPVPYEQQEMIHKANLLLEEGKESAIKWRSFEETAIQFPESLQHNKQLLDSAEEEKEKTLKSIGKALRLYEDILKENTSSDKQRYKIMFSMMEGCQMIRDEGKGMEIGEQILKIPSLSPKLKACILYSLGHLSWEYTKKHNTDYSQAKKYYQEALTINPNYPEDQNGDIGALSTIRLFTCSMSELDSLRNELVENPSDKGYAQLWKKADPLLKESLQIARDAEKRYVDSGYNYLLLVYQGNFLASYANSLGFFVGYDEIDYPFREKMRELNEEAVRIYTKAIKARDTSKYKDDQQSRYLMHCLFGLGKCSLDAGDYEKAIEYFQEQIDYIENNPVYYYLDENKIPVYKLKSEEPSKGEKIFPGYYYMDKESILKFIEIAKKKLE